jgi:hypothetical protein
MSLPANELDVYASYTYHFELYATNDVNQLYQYEYIDNSKVGTTRTAPNGDLILNTRRDAFQNIEDVHYYITSPLTGVVAATGAQGGCVMQIREPNGFGFVDKMQQVVNSNNVISASNLVYALKTVFVGRKPDNSIEVKSDIPLLIMGLTSMDMTFTEQGSVYNLTFVTMAGFDAHVSSETSDAIIEDMTTALGTVSRSVGFSGRTIAEAISNFETNLNRMYSEYYKESGTDKIARPVRYVVNLGSGIEGNLDSLNKEHFGSNAPAKFAYEPKAKIAAIIHDVLSHCAALNDKLAGTSNGQDYTTLLKGKYSPVVTSSLQLTATEALVTYNVALYDAFTTQFNEDNKGSYQYIFDYYFADPGSNVDVTHMELKINWGGLDNAISSRNNFPMLDKAANISSTLPTTDPKHFANNLVTENKSIDQLIKTGEVGTTYFYGKQYDIAIMPFVNEKDRAGYPSIPADQLTSARLATKVVTDGYSGYGFNATMTIRGNYNMLKVQGNYPNNEKTSALNIGMFVKVNIYNEVKDPKTGKVQKTPFFYRGWYRILTIENVFSGGLFTQNISMIAVEDPNADNSSTDNSTSTSSGGDVRVQENGYSFTGGSTFFTTPVTTNLK